MVSIPFSGPMVFVAAVAGFIFLMVLVGRGAKRGMQALERAEEKSEEKLMRLEQDELKNLERARQGEEYEAQLEQMELSNEQRLHAILSKILQALSTAYRFVKYPNYVAQIIKANVNLYYLALSTALTIQKELKDEQYRSQAESKVEKKVEAEEKQQLGTEKQIEREETAEASFFGRMGGRELMVEKAETKKAEAETGQELKITAEEKAIEKQKLNVITKELSAITVISKSIVAMREVLRKADIKRGYQECAGCLRMLMQIENFDKYNLSLSQRADMDIRRDEQLDQMEEAQTIGAIRKLKSKAMRAMGRKRLF
jgi:hypothetical protein